MRTILAAAFLAAAFPVAAADHPHHDHGAKLQLDQGRKWPTDAALRKGMDALRAELSARHGAARKKALKPEDHVALGRFIEARVAGIVAECKLDARADAMLHIVIADLGEAAELLKGSQPGEGLHKAVRAANDYGRHFDHPGWKPVR